MTGVQTCALPIYNQFVTCAVSSSFSVRRGQLCASELQDFNIGFVASTLYDALPELIRRFRIIAPDAEVNLLETDQVLTRARCGYSEGLGTAKVGAG